VSAERVLARAAKLGKNEYATYLRRRVVEITEA
jgi:glucose-1-phosphate thymidylyltransferase